MPPKSPPLDFCQIRLLAVLALINFVNFAARQVFGSLIPLLRSDLHLRDAQLGSLQTWLLIVLAVVSIPFGFLADRYSRKRIIFFGVICWSVATFAGGFAGSFLFLFVARAFVGIGEAAYAPAAQSMISGGFPEERRAMAQAVFASGMLLGGAAGQAFGGVISMRYNWEYALFAVGILGVIPALATLSLPEPPRGPCSDLVPIPRLLSVPAFVTMIAGGTCITFASVSLLTWGVDYAVTYKEFSLRQASVSFALIALLSLLCGVLCGGYIADRLQKRYAFGRIIAIAAAVLLAAPFLFLAIQSDEQSVVLAGLFITLFFMSWYHGPVTAVIHGMMPRRAHATSIGLYMFVTQLVGGLGPQIVGRISDLRDLQFGLQISVAVMVFGGLLMFLVIHFVRRDGLCHPALSTFHAEAD